MGGGETSKFSNICLYKKNMVMHGYVFKNFYIYSLDFIMPPSHNAALNWSN